MARHLDFSPTLRIGMTSGKLRHGKKGISRELQGNQGLGSKYSDDRATRAYDRAHRFPRCRRQSRSWGTDRSAHSRKCRERSRHLTNSRQTKGATCRHRPRILHHWRIRHRKRSNRRAPGRKFPTFRSRYTAPHTDTGTHRSRVRRRSNRRCANTQDR